MFGLSLAECLLVLCVSVVLMLGVQSYQRYQVLVWQQRLQAHQQHVMAAQQDYAWQQRQQRSLQAVGMVLASMTVTELLPEPTQRLPMLEEETLGVSCVAHCEHPQKAQWVVRWTVLLSETWRSRVRAWAAHLGWQPMDAQGVRWYVQQPLQHFSRLQPSWSQAFAHANTVTLQRVLEEGE